MNIVRMFFGLLILVVYLGIGNIIYKHTHPAEPVKVEGLLLKAIYGTERHETDRPSSTQELAVTTAWLALFTVSGILHFLYFLLPMVFGFIGNNLLILFLILFFLSLCSHIGWKIFERKYIGIHEWRVMRAVKRFKAGY